MARSMRQRHPRRKATRGMYTEGRGTYAVLIKQRGFGNVVSEYHIKANSRTQARKKVSAIIKKQHRDDELQAGRAQRRPGYDSPMPRPRYDAPKRRR